MFIQSHSSPKHETGQKSGHKSGHKSGQKSGHKTHQSPCEEVLESLSSITVLFTSIITIHGVAIFDSY